jgi:hypothetical protein
MKYATNYKNMQQMQNNGRRKFCLVEYKTPYIPLKINRHVGTTVCLCLQGQVFSQARNQREAVSVCVPLRNF